MECQMVTSRDWCRILQRHADSLAKSSACSSPIAASCIMCASTFTTKSRCQAKVLLKAVLLLLPRHLSLNPSKNFAVTTASTCSFLLRVKA